MFEKAAQMKLRFNTVRGNISCEDLFDMNLEGEFSLNAIAQDLDSNISKKGVKNFVTKAKTTNRIDELRFNIVKHVIEIRLDDIEANETSAANKAQKQKILGIIDGKKDEALAEMSVKDLKKMVKKL